MANIQEIPRGQLSTIILMCLVDCDKYGYEIIDDVLKKTNGQMSIKQPSLYSSLKRMEEQSLISSYWRDSDIGGKRHYYHLTDLGKKHLEKWQNNISYAPTPQIETTKVLQQENLFNISKEPTVNQNAEEKPISQIISDDSYVQFDLFSNTLAQDKPENNNNVDNNINNLSKTNHADLPNIKQFEYIKKGNKSFSEAIKNISEINHKKYEEKNAKPAVSNPPLSDDEIISINNISQHTSQNELNNQKIDLCDLKGYVSNKTVGNNNENTFKNDDSPLQENFCSDDLLNKNIKNINQDELNLSNSLQEKNEVKDDGVIITERLDISDIPKNPPFEARRFEIYISDTNLTPRYKTENTYEDRVKDLYEKSKTNAENQELELIDSKVKFSTYADLQNFYNEQNIKFKPYKKTLYKSDKNFDMIRISKLNMLTSLFMFGAYSLISVLFAIIFSFAKNVKLNNPITYIVFPVVLFIIFVINFIIYHKSPQKRIAYDINKFKFNNSYFILSMLILPVVLSFNLLFGLTFESLGSYSLSLFYPCTLCLIYVIYYTTQKQLSKCKELY